MSRIYPTPVINRTSPSVSVSAMVANLDTTASEQLISRRERLKKSKSLFDPESRSKSVTKSNDSDYSTVSSSTQTDSIGSSSGSTSSSDGQGQVSADDFQRVLAKLETLTAKLDSHIKASRVGDNENSAKRANDDNDDNDDDYNDDEERESGEAESNGEPVFELKNKKWSVANQKGRDDLVIEKTNAKQTIHVNKCTECKLKIRTKVNSIRLTRCKNMVIEFENMLSKIELVGCDGMELRVDDECPSISLNRSRASKIYLSNKSWDSSIKVRQSTDTDVVVPTDSENEAVNRVPEQFKVSVNSKSKKLIVIPDSESSS